MALHSFTLSDNSMEVSYNRSHTDSSKGEIDGRIYLEIDVNDVEYSRTSEERP